MYAVLFHRSANYLGKQRFRDETCFGVSTSGRGKRAAVAANEMLALALVKGSCTPHFLEKAESCFDPLLSGFAFNFQ